MTNDGNSSFEVGIDFEQVLAAISKQIYETPLAFLRENVQNAIDAVRIQALRQAMTPGDPSYRVDVLIEGKECRIRDNGIGMTRDDLRRYFWTIGASGKRNPEARLAGCVGMFGIGGFANLGVCDELKVISQVEGESIGTETCLSESDIKSASGGIPQVKTSNSSLTKPRGTLVIGKLRHDPNVGELERYLVDFVQHAKEHVYFNGSLISGKSPLDSERSLPLRDVAQTWSYNNIELRGRLFEDKRHVLSIELEGLKVDGEVVLAEGRLKIEHGAVDVFKQGFKLCATKIETTVGVSGRIDCNRLSPTAGRDSLDSESTVLLGRIFSCVEWIAVSTMITSTERMSQNPSVFAYVLRNGWIQHIGKHSVRLADGSDTTLENLKLKAEGGVGIYYGRHSKQALNQIMQARGNLVVILATDYQRQQAETRYLETYCKAKQFDGVVECSETYDDLTRFEMVFMSELEMNVQANYDILGISMTAGKITEDIPVYIPERSVGGAFQIYVDVRHAEIKKLEPLGFTPLLYSMVAAFTREYLGPTLRTKSPKFFGNGAINLESLAKRRSELWILLRDDVGILAMGKQKEVVRSSDVQVMRVGEPVFTPPTGQKTPKILQIIASEELQGISGYYLRIPDGASRAYGDAIKECDNRGAVWAGNKILFVASDAVSSAFQFEIRLDRLVVVTGLDAQQTVEGAFQLEKPIQSLHDGLYFPIPTPLEFYLIPRGDEEVRIEIRCDWIDMKTRK